MTPQALARRAILFDLDGTLVDSADDIASSIGDVLRESGLDALDVATVTRLIGDGASVLVARAFGAHGREAPEGAVDRFRERYDERCLERTRCYPGIDGLVAALSAAGQSIAVVTNKPTALARKVVDGVGLGPHVSAVVGPELAIARKPSPEHVLAALRLIGVDAGDAVVVGDGTTDLAAGRGAGAATIAVTWGYRPLRELEAERPDAIARDVGELSRLLLPGPA